MLIDPTHTECKKIVDDLIETQPLLIQDTLQRIKKVEPHYNYLFTLTDVLKKYCEIRGLKYTDNKKHEIRGINIGQAMVQERSQFIAVVLWLFSPSVYKIGKRTLKKDKTRKEFAPIYNAENGIRHNLGGILGCNEEWISQQVNPIAVNYHGRNEQFRGLVDKIVAEIKFHVIEGYVEPPKPKSEPLPLFQ